MIEIRSWLYVGKHTDTLNDTVLTNHGIEALLELHEPSRQERIPSLFVPLRDGEPLNTASLERAIGFVQAHSSDGERVMVACSAGISRSPMVATASIKVIENRSLRDAFNEVRAMHPRAMPDHIHWEGLCAYFGEDIPFWDIWRELKD
jgi:protein-tyrosine phosphatase